jgi:hypothetical protein
VIVKRLKKLNTIQHAVRAFGRCTQIKNWGLYQSIETRRRYLAMASSQFLLGAAILMSDDEDAEETDDEEPPDSPDIVDCL